MVRGRGVARVGRAWDRHGHGRGRGFPSVIRCPHWPTFAPPPPLPSPFRYEAYDLNKDPYQLTNIYDQLQPDKRTALASLAHELWQCTGKSCP